MTAAAAGTRRSASFVLALAVVVLAGTVAAQGRAIGPGSRLMYYASSATVRGSLTQAVWKEDCDPSVEDCWIDPATGRTAANVEIPTPAGEGYTQVDVLYLDDRVCVFRVGNHVRDVLTGIVSAGGTQAVVSRDGCADYWTPPERLAALQGPAGTGLRVLRGPYTLAGQTFDAVSISSLDPAARQHAAYDAASGLLVVQSGRATGGTIPVIGGDGQVTTGAGSTLLTYGQLVGRTTIPAVPAPGPLPPAVAGVTGLSYACTTTLAFAGNPPLQFPCRQDVEVIERASHWLATRVVRQTASAMGPIPDVAESSEVIVAGGHGGLYASPGWLRTLSAGAVLEDDAITGVRVWVDQVGGGVVTIVAASATQRGTLVYDLQSGWLVRAVQEQATGPQTATVVLDLQQVR